MRKASYLCWVQIVLLCLRPRTCDGFPEVAVGHRQWLPSSFQNRYTTLTQSADAQSSFHTKRRHHGVLTQGTSSSLMAFPTCTATNVHVLALAAGGTGLVAQAALTKLFTLKQCPPNIQKHAAYTAHNTIALGLMLLFGSMGIAGWWGLSMPLTATGRLVVASDASRWLAAVACGFILIWDVPTSLGISSLRKPDVIIHHVAMALVAYIGAVYLPMHYLFFYLGVSELSSIPLIVYDQLHFLSELETKAEDSVSGIVSLRDKVQVLAAIAFTAIRAVLFTKVTLFHFVPDVLSVLPLGGNPLRFGMIASLAFTALQLFWFSKMLNVLLNVKESKNGNVT